MASMAYSIKILFRDGTETLSFGRFATEAEAEQEGRRYYADSRVRLVVVISETGQNRHDIERYGP